MESAFNTSAYNSSGSAQRENEKYLDSIEGKMTQFNNKLQEIMQSFIESQWIKDFIDLGKSALDVFSALSDKIGSLGALLTTAMGFLGLTGRGIVNLDFKKNKNVNGKIFELGALWRNGKERPVEDNTLAALLDALKKEIEGDSEDNPNPGSEPSPTPEVSPIPEPEQNPAPTPEQTPAPAPTPEPEQTPPTPVSEPEATPSPAPTPEPSKPYTFDDWLNDELVSRGLKSSDETTPAPTPEPETITTDSIVVDADSSVVEGEISPEMQEYNAARADYKNARGEFNKRMMAAYGVSDPKEIKKAYNEAGSKLANLNMKKIQLTNESEKESLQKEIDKINDKINIYKQTSEELGLADKRNRFNYAASNVGKQSESQEDILNYVPDANDTDTTTDNDVHIDANDDIIINANNSDVNVDTDSEVNTPTPTPIPETEETLQDAENSSGIKLELNNPIVEDTTPTPSPAPSPIIENEYANKTKSELKKIIKDINKSEKKNSLTDEQVWERKRAEAQLNVNAAQEVANKLGVGNLSPLEALAKKAEAGSILANSENGKFTKEEQKTIDQAKAIESLSEAIQAALKLDEEKANESDESEESSPADSIVDTIKEAAEGAKGDDDSTDENSDSTDENSDSLDENTEELRKLNENLEGQNGEDESGDEEGEDEDESDSDSDSDADEDASDTAEDLTERLGELGDAADQAGEQIGEQAEAGRVLTEAQEEQADAADNSANANRNEANASNNSANADRNEAGASNESANADRNEAAASNAAAGAGGGKSGFMSSFMGSAGNFLLGIGTGLLNSAINAALMAITSAIINKGVEFVKELTKTEEEKLAETISKFEESTQNLISDIKKNEQAYEEQLQLINDVSKEYDTLRKGVNTSTNKNLTLSDDEYERYIKITQQLGNQFDSLVDKVDNTGNYILKLGDASKTTTEMLLEAAKQEKQKNAINVYNDIISDYGSIDEYISSAVAQYNHYSGKNDTTTEQNIYRIISTDETRTEQDYKDFVDYMLSDDVDPYKKANWGWERDKGFYADFLEYMYNNFEDDYYSYTNKSDRMHGQTATMYVNLPDEIKNKVLEQMITDINNGDYTDILNKTDLGVEIKNKSISSTGNYKEALEILSSFADIYNGELSDNAIQVMKSLVLNIEEGAEFSATDLIENLKDGLKELSEEEINEILHFDTSYLRIDDALDKTNKIIEKYNDKINSGDLNFWSNYFNIDGINDIKSRLDTKLNELGIGNEKKLKGLFPALFDTSGEMINDQATIDIYGYIKKLNSAQLQKFLEASVEDDTLAGAWASYQAYIRKEISTFEWDDESNKTLISKYQEQWEKLNEYYKILTQGGTLTPEQKVAIEQMGLDIDLNSEDLANDLFNLSNKAFVELIDKMTELGATADDIDLISKLFGENVSIEEAFHSLDNAVDTTQSKLTSYMSAINQLKSGGFGATELTDWLQDYNFSKYYAELDKFITIAREKQGESFNEDDAYNQGMIEIMNQLTQDAMDKAGIYLTSTLTDTNIIAGALQQVEKQAYLSAAGVDTAANAIGNMKTSYTDLVNTTQEWGTKGKLSSDTITSLMSSYPEMSDELNDYLLNPSEEAYQKIVEKLKEAYLEDYDNYKLYLKYKMLTDESFYEDNVLPNCDEATKKLQDELGIQLDDYKTYVEAKADIDAAYYEALELAENNEAANYRRRAAALSAQAKTVTDSNAKIALEREIANYNKKAKESESANTTAEETERAKKLKELSSKVEGIYEDATDNYINDNYGLDGLTKLFDSELFDPEKGKTVIDWFEYLADEIDKIIQKINTAIETAESAMGKNSLLDSLISVDRVKMKDYEAAAQMYQNYANTFLEKIPTQYRAMAQNGAIAITDFVSNDYNGQITEAIQNYRTYRDKALDAENQSRTLANEIKNNLVAQVTNLANEFTRLNSILETANTDISSISSLVSSMGYNEQSETALRSQLANSIEEGKRLAVQRTALEQQMAKAIANGVTVGSDEWETMNNALETNRQNIIKNKQEQENYNKAIALLPVDRVNQLSEAYSKLNSTLSFIASGMDTEVVTKGAQGIGFTDDALTALGMYTQSIAVNKQLIKDIDDAIEDLKTKFNNGELTEKEYGEQYADLVSKQQSAANEVKNSENSITDIYKKQYAERIQLVTDLINKKKEELQAEKDAYEWRKTLINKQRALLNEERKMNALSAGASSDRATNAAYVAQQATYQETAEDLQDTVDDHNYQTTNTALDKETEIYTASQNNMTTNSDSIIAEMRKNGYADIGDTRLEYKKYINADGVLDYDSLKKDIKSLQDTSQDMTDTLNENAKTVSDNIKRYSEETGVKISEDLIKAWANGKKAVDNYTLSVDSMTSSTMILINKIINGVDLVRTQSEVATQNLLNMFGLTSSQTITLVNTLAASLATCDSTVKTVLSEVQQFLNIQNAGITGVFKGINTELGKADTKLDSILDKLNKVKTEESDTSGESINSWAVKQWEYNEKSGIKSKKTTIQKNAVGGVVTAHSGTYVSAGSPFDAIARRLGEDTMIAAKVGERVLTVDQNAQWEAWTNAMPQLLMHLDDLEAINSSAPVSSPIILNVDSGITINGNADENILKDLEKMQNQIANNVTNKIANALKNNIGLKVNAFNKSVY